MKLSDLQYFWVVLPCLGCSQHNKKAETDNHRDNPNIVLILADDMGYGDPTCYNPSSRIQTPNIDRIAERGIRLTDAYAHPWCVPSRYGLLTGRHPLRTELNWRERALIEPGQLTLASLLQRNGYYTAMTGKWHLGFDVKDWDSIRAEDILEGGPADHGFDYFFGMHASLDLPPYFFIENKMCVKPPSEHIRASHSPDATRPTSGEFWREGNIAPGFRHEEVDSVFLARAVKLLTDYQQSGKKKPFFLYYALTSPHTPWLPESVFKGKSGAGDYGDFALQVDNNVGKILQVLEDLDLEDETLVIFASDNGPLWYLDDIRKYGHRAAGELRGMKNDTWEGGHRVPFLAQWPGKIPPGVVRNDIVSFDDLISTFAALVGDDVPEKSGLDSYNMLYVLLNRSLKKPVREYLVMYENAIRSGDWKYIDRSGEGRISKLWINDSTYNEKSVPGELYNLKDDIGERNNLFFNKPELVKGMSDKLNDFKLYLKR